MNTNQGIECYQDQILQEDMEQVVNTCSGIDSLHNSSVLVTGATGLLGSQVVLALACANRLKGAGIRILAQVRSQEKAERIFGKDLLSRGDVVLVFGDVTEKLTVDEPVDYIMHGASATSSKFFVEHPVETIDILMNGTKNMLELAREKKCKGMVFLSSLEVYGVPNTPEGRVSESDAGYIDCTSVRSSYSEGKRMVECLCAAYASEYGVPVKIARLSQTFGAGVEYTDGRVFAEFARCAVEGHNAVLHTQGNTLRTYCYTADAVNGILTILALGKVGEAYNITNKATDVTIREMANIALGVFPEKNLSLEFDLPENLASFGYNPEMVIRLETDKLEALGWKANVDLKEMFERMIRSWGK